MNKSDSYVIGVDAGGSKTHAIIVDKNNQIITESFAGPGNISKNIDVAYASITEAIDTLLLKYQVKKIGIGVAGYSVKHNLHILEQKLVAKYPHVKIQSDAHIACLAAHDGLEGAILICGTGVVGYSIMAGNSQQLGGWGYPHGDLGGGAWLGLEICKLVCKAADKIIPWSPLLTIVYSRFNDDYTQYKMWLLSATPGDMAGVARSISEFLISDSNARKIFDCGAAEVSQYLQTLEKQSLPLKLVGGLAPFYLNVLQQDFPGLSLSTAVPAMGATYLVRY